jgi:hypothetical protein
LIILTRRLAKRLKTVIRQTLNLPRGGNLPTVQLSAGPDGLRVRCGNGPAAIEFHLEGEQPQQILFIPFEMLADIESGRDVPVEITARDGKVTASWSDRAIPQSIEHEAPTVLSENFPPTPDVFAENPSDLLDAIREAAKTTDAESSRYALGCIQFRGGEGDLVATDGRQALIQGGYDFPWDDDLLIPTNKVLGSKQLPVDESVFVGQAGDWAALRIGPWTLWLSIEKDARFPDVAAHLRQSSDAAATCTIEVTDRQFLLDNVLNLPCEDEYNRPVTVDLNGSVAVRGKRTSDTPATELVLSASTRAGEAIRFNSDRRYLHRAAQLGFAQLYVYDDKSLVLASDERRQFFWALLEPGAAIAHEDNTICIESQPINRVSLKNATTHTRRTAVTTKTNHRNNGMKCSSEGSESEQNDPITAAETLRDSLRHSLQSTTELVRTLKRHRKRNKAVESTLLSLRQLQAIDA